MPFIFERKNREASPNSLIRSNSGTSYSDDVEVLPSLVTSPRGRTRKTSRVLTTSQYDSTIISIASTSVGSNDSGSNAHPSHDRPPSIGIADLALQSNDYTALLLQASPNHDPNDTSTAPGTEQHSRDISLDVPPSTPIFQDSEISMEVLPAIFQDREMSVSVMEGITYDAILASTLHKNLAMMEGMKYLDIPHTTTPPNSPVAIQEGMFGSLMGVSMAIMQGGT